MASYYYLMTQLPSIMPHADPPLSYGQFKEIALRFLNTKDAKTLEYITLTPPKKITRTKSTLVTAWCEFERNLRSALEQMRATRLKRETSVIASSCTGSSAFDIEKIVHGVSALDDPLAAEQFLLAARLTVAEELRRLHFFDSEAVFGYGIVLLLSERASKFKVESGNKAYHSVYTKILGEEHDRN